MIIRRPPPDVALVEVEAIDENEDVEAVLKEVKDEYAETSERLEVVRVRGFSEAEAALDAEPGSGDTTGGETAEVPDVKDVRGRGAREEGGTSCTCKLRG